MHSQNLESIHHYFRDLLYLKQAGEDFNLSQELLEHLTNLFGSVAQDAKQLEAAALKIPFTPDRRGAVEIRPAGSNVIVFRPRKEQENTNDLVS